MLNLKKVNLPEPKTEYIVKMREFKGLNLSCDQGLVPIEESPQAYNVDCSQGTLSRAAGFGDATLDYLGNEKTISSLPSRIVKLFELREGGNRKTGYNNFYFSADNGKLYKFIYNDADDCFEANSVDAEFESSGKYTYFTQYKYLSKDRVLLGGDEAEPCLYEVADGRCVLLTGGNLPKMSRTAVHYSRTFGIGDKEHPQRIWFSALYSHCNFEVSEEEGGYIDITDNIGDTIDVISFFDTLYVFCRYGIVALNTLGQERDYSLENVYYSSSEIIPGSVCVCGGNILFCTCGGVYAFNGISVSLLSAKIRNFFIDKDIASDEVCSVWYKGNYFVSYFENTNKTRGVLIYDSNVDKWQVLDNVFVSALIYFKDNKTEKLIAALDGGSRLAVWGGKRNNGCPPSIWKSTENDFGLPATKKMFREVHFVASGDGIINISLVCDNKRQTRKVELSPQKKSYGLRFDVSGSCVRFEIENEDGCYFNILPITFIYSAEREQAK